MYYKQVNLLYYKFFYCLHPFIYFFCTVTVFSFFLEYILFYFLNLVLKIYLFIYSELMLGGGECSVKCPRGFYQEVSKCHRFYLFQKFINIKHRKVSKKCINKYFEELYFKMFRFFIRITFSLFFLQLFYVKN